MFWTNPKPYAFLPLSHDVHQQSALVTLVDAPFHLFPSLHEDSYFRPLGIFSVLPSCQFLPGGVATLHSQVCYVVVHPESLSKFFLLIYLKRLTLTSFNFAHILNLYHLRIWEAVKVKWLCSQDPWIQIQTSCMTLGELFIYLFLALVSSSIAIVEGHWDNSMSKTLRIRPYKCLPWLCLFVVFHPWVVGAVTDS